MPNLTGYSRVILAPASILTHDIQYTGTVTADNGTVLGDFSGANAVKLLTVLNTLTAAQGLEFADICAAYLLRIKFPAAFP